MAGPDVRAIEAAALSPEPFPAVQQEFRIRIAEEAFDRATARGQADVTREVGGVLVGHVGRDAAGPHILVVTTIDALHAEEKGTELTFTHATWEHIHKEMDAKHAGRKIVGWYHTHPGFGIFLSDRDQFIHNSFFDLPFQVALVYDPKSREHGVFAWRDGEPVRWRRYWIGDREHQWDGPRASAAGAGAGSLATATAAGVGGGGTLPAGAQAGTGVPDLDRWSLGMGAALLLVVGGLLGWWLGRGTAPREGPDSEAAVAKIRADGRDDFARLVNGQVVGLLRRVMTDGPVRKALDEAQAALDEGLKAIPENAAPSSAAIERLRAGRDALARLRQSHDLALANLRTLEEESARLQPVDARILVSSLSQQAAVLGRVCAELGAEAHKAGDSARAEGWLALAGKIDPQNLASHRRTVLATSEGGGR